MHHALRVQEILLNIVGHCCPPSLWTDASDLPALARTCRAFKEPALDAVWGHLTNPSALARCLPEASRYSTGIASFTRSLTPTEWGILRSYTRRVRYLMDCYDKLDWKSVKIFLNPSASEPLFPNLRRLYTAQSTQLELLFSIPYPSLVEFVFELREEDVEAIPGSLVSFSRSSQDIKRISIHLYCPDIPFSNVFSGCICRWHGLQTVICPDITLDRDALVHLSRIPALTELSFMLNGVLPDQITPSDSSALPLFCNLRDLTIFSQSLEPISRLLPRIRPPTLEQFKVFIENQPSKQDVSFFFGSIQTSNAGHTMQTLALDQWHPRRSRLPRPVLLLEDLQPCTTFSNLRGIAINVDWQVDLTDDDLLALVSAWPRLERLLLNNLWGWSASGGITPDGLPRLVQMCRSLVCIALAVDTRGYTANLISPGSLGRSLHHNLSIDVLDSKVEEESVPAVTAFFAGLTAVSSLSFWHCWERDEVYVDRWNDVCMRIKDVVPHFSYTTGPVV